MRTLPLLICTLVASSIAAPSRIELLSTRMWMNGDTLVKIVEIHGIQGSDGMLSRIPWGFNPESQQVSLDLAVRGDQDGEMYPVPAWAVDTLNGSGGWDRTLVTVFPALSEGMRIEYRIRVDDCSGNWQLGPWAIISPSMKGIPADTVICMMDSEMMENLAYSASGYEVSLEQGWTRFTSNGVAGDLVISPFHDPSSLEEYLLQESLLMLEEPYPPDLREAALQVTGAGTDTWAMVMRARSLLCNSISPASPSRGDRISACRPIQSILDSRSATPLEMATVFTAICRELGIRAYLAPAGPVSMPPVPSLWNRFLVQVFADEGDSWLVEPSAYLTQASWVFRPESLMVVSDGNSRVLAPNPPGDNDCRELWTIDVNEGTFSLALQGAGWYDMSLRRRTAGLTDDEIMLVMAEWSWRSGRTAVPDSLAMSDPFDLADPLRLVLHGRLWDTPKANPTVVRLPALRWDRPDSVFGEISRTWLLQGTGNVYSSLLSTEITSNGAVLLEDTSGTHQIRSVLLEMI